MVQCRKCGNNNRLGARFCGHCGALLVNTAPLALGTVVHGRYEVVSLLGKGGMGAVYQVQDQKVFGKRWAVKELINTFADSADWMHAIQQFETEARMLVSLSHPNLPQIADFFSEGGRQYLVMEYVEGETLEATLTKTPGFLPEATVLSWAAQLCDVLSYLHAQKPNPVVFRDLKPDNIMLTLAGTIKLIDFGIARIFDPTKKTDTLKMGTIGYAPPEQYAGHGQTDARSDIYALGVTLHRLLSKHDPSTQPFVFPRPDKLNNRISPNTVQVILKATDVDPSKRYQSAADMRADLLPASGKASAAPAAPASLPRTPRVFVANLGDGTITVIDAATNTTQSALYPSASQSYPHLGPLAITPDGKLCIALNRNPNVRRSSSHFLGAMTVFDLSTLKEARTVTVFKDHLPTAMTASHDSQVIITSDQGACIVDPSMGQVTRQLDLKERLAGVAAAPTGKVFVASASSNHVFVIDTRTYAVMSVIKVGSQPLSVVVAPDNKVWVAHLGELKILGIDESTNLVRSTIQMSASFFGPSGFRNLTVTPNGKVYATAGSGRAVFVSDPKTGASTSQIQVGRKPAGLAVSDQGMVYVACSDDNTVAVIDSASDKVVATVGVGRRPSHIAFG